MMSQSESAVPGSPIASKSDQVRALLQQGVAPGQIAEQVGCSRNLVYSIRGGAGAGAPRPPRHVGEPAAAVAPGPDFGSILAAIRQSQQQTATLRDGLLRIQAIVDELLR
jgi:hypothetical protein